jgi:hypothetical protein
MGTKNMTIVVSNGETKVAQYGQWDGYYSGQGLDALAILRKLDLQDFKAKVDALQEYTTEEYDAIPDDQNFKEKYPELHRDTAAKILQLVADGKATKVSIQPNFVTDSLFCEYAYVVDLDKQTFEVYKGYNKTPLTPEDRFYKAPVEGEEVAPRGYYPVKLMHSFSLAELPTPAEFLETLEPKEGEDED